MRHPVALWAIAVFAIFVFPLAPATANTTSSQALGSVALSWTATGDDGMVGRAKIYELRHNLTPITAFNFFSTSTLVVGVPAPAVPGTRQYHTVTGLVAGTTYHFAIRTMDDAGNWSGISNVATRVAVSTVDVPAGPTHVVHFGNPFPNPARSHASFAMTLPEPTDIDVTVFDIQGRQVRVLADGDWPAGESTVAWNLRDGGGSKVSPGTYMVRAQIGSTRTVRRVTVVG